jgi:hypothetical protein
VRLVVIAMSEAKKQSINKAELGFQVFFQEKPFLWIATLRAKLSLAMTGFFIIILLIGLVKKSFK